MQERAASGGKGSVSTLESLSVFMTLEQARKQHGFQQAEFGIDDAEAFNIARIFSKCVHAHEQCCATR